jgi:N-acetyl-anhydromuramyl-L-alanine amidase AmpD
LHHQGEIVASDVDVPAYLRRLQQWSRLTRRWTDIPYHYVIAPDGVVYSARPLAEPGDTNTDYQPIGHALVMVMGNFEVQQPRPAQLASTAELMAWIAQTQGLTAAEIATHKDFSHQTVCPGKNLDVYVRNGWLHQAVAARMAGQPLPAW